MSLRALLLAPLLLATTPDTAAADAGNRPGREVVGTVCSNCHQAGLNGAPKVGDRAAWVPRMKRGLHELSLAAIRGHGGMPARGGKAALTDTEVRDAIVYMFDPEAEARAAARPASAPTSVRGPNEATVDGMDVHFGLVPAARLRAYPTGSAEARMHGGVPSGSGYYHVNVTLLDAAKHTPVANAAIEVEVVQAGAETQSRALDAIGSGATAGYGQYLRLVPKLPSRFTVRIRPAGATRSSEARFTPTPE